MIPSHTLTGPEDAPTLVLSNSLGTDYAMWDDQVPALERHFRLLRYDQRGHGRTPATPGPYKLDELGTDVLELLDHLGLRRVHFAGLSLGGMIGLWLGAHAPERVDRLALLCTSAALPGNWIERAALVREHGTASLVDATLQRWFTARALSRTDVTGKVAAMLRACTSEGYAGCCEAIAEMDLRPVLPRITVPTLVLSGRDDPATPPEHGERIARGCGARFEVLDDAAHLANVERADTVTQLLLEHFTDDRTERD